MPLRTINWVIDETPGAVSASFADSDGTKGITREDTGASLVAVNTPLTRTSTGLFTYTFFDPNPSVTYTYVIKWIQNAQTYYTDSLVSAPPDATGLLTMAKLRDEILVGLGAEAIDIEIGQRTCDKTIADAIRQINRHHPPVGWFTINFTSSMPMYTLVLPGLYGILEIDGVRNWFPNSNTGLGISPFMFYPGFMLAYSPFGMAGDLAGDFDMTMTYQQSNRIVFGQDFDWNARLVSLGTVQLFVRADPGSQIMGQYCWHLTPDDSPDTGVSFLPPADLDWVIRYATALAKQILGRVIRKYADGVNMPDGNVEQLDGAALKAEGREEQKELEQLLRKRRRPLIPQKG